MIVNLLRIIHAALIAFVIFKMVQGKQLGFALVYGELGLTLFRAVIEGRLKTWGFKFQLLASLFLCYTFFPNKLEFVCWLFFFKNIQVHKALKSVRNSSTLLNSGGVFNYVAFIFDLLRYSICEYIVIGIALMVYRHLTDCRSEPLPGDNALMYQFVVTASTIGYGDLFPKSQMQIIFLTYLIPILCGSFVVYSNHLVDIFTKTFLAENSSQQCEQKA